jgi:uncharacterized protein (DUF1330 family)
MNPQGVTAFDVQDTVPEMSGYLLAHVKNVHNPDGLTEYGEKTPDLITSYGGRYLVRGGDVDPVEAHQPLGAFVVVEFPSYEVAKQFYYGDEYRRLTAIRQAAADVDMILVDGFTG